jgi:hypothetical protein
MLDQLDQDNDLLSRFYGGENDTLEVIFERHHRDLHWLLGQCVEDDEVALQLLEELYAAVYVIRLGRGRQFDPARGTVKGHLIAMAGALAYKWQAGRLDLCHHGVP